MKSSSRGVEEGKARKSPGEAGQPGRRLRKKPTKNVQNTRKIYWYKERMERCYGLNQKQLLTECYIKIKYRFTMKKNWFWMESFYIQIS